MTGFWYVEWVMSNGYVAESFALNTEQDALRCMRRRSVEHPTRHYRVVYREGGAK